MTHFAKKQASMQQEVEDYQKKVERSLERARDDGFDELMRVVQLVIPEDILTQWEETYKDPRFIKVDIDKVCTRCGAIVYQGGKAQHRRWHKNHTFVLWMMQSGILDSSRRLDNLADEAGEEVERP